MHENRHRCGVESLVQQEIDMIAKHGLEEARTGKVKAELTTCMAEPRGGWGSMRS